MKILFHGSNVGIEEIDLSKCQPGKDFGCGFYLSDDEQQAINMAQFKALTMGGEATLTVFEFQEQCLTDGSLHVKCFDDYCEEWARFILENRGNTSRANLHDYDIIYGPIANDRIGAQIRRLEFGDIDIETFLEKIKYVKGVTYQYFFGTEKALLMLKKV